MLLGQMLADFYGEARVGPQGYDLSDQTLVGETLFVQHISRPTNRAPATGQRFQSRATPTTISTTCRYRAPLVARRNGGDCLGNQCYFECPTVVALQGVFANIELGLNQLRLAH